MRATEEQRNEIYLSYEHIGEGTTASGVLCPACQGGSEQEKSFSVSRRGGTLLFNCHRSSCNLRGAVQLSGMPTFGEEQRGTNLSPRYPRIKAQPLGGEAATLLASRYRIPAESIEYSGFGWTGDAHSRYGRRVAMPIYGPNGKERGASYRSYEGVAPKAIVDLRTTDDLVASWYKWLRRSDNLMVVEDQVSAVRLAPFTHSLALVGTNFPIELADEVAQQGYKRVIICLDNDATSKAIKLQLMFRTKIKGLEVRGLAKDIKDMNDEEFQEHLQRTELLQPRAVSEAEQPAV